MILLLTAKQFKILLTLHFFQLGREIMTYLLRFLFTVSSFVLAYCLANIIVF